MTKNIFSEFREPGGVKLKGFTSGFRKVAHSARDRLALSGTVKQAVTPDWNTPGKVLEYSAQAGGLMGLGGGAAAIASAAAGSTLFVMAVGGPQVAVTGGVIGLALMVKEAYSNREKQHEALIPYVWSLIDDERPQYELRDTNQSENLNKAANHAIYLMKEADSQFDHMGKKLKIAETNFITFMRGYTASIAPLVAAQGHVWPGTAMMAAYASSRVGGNQAKIMLADNDALTYFLAINKAKVESEKLWVDASKQGNEVFEYMRRLSHVGNYLQCAYIIDLATISKLQGGVSGVQATSDPLMRWTGTQAIRTRLETISNVKKEADANYTAFKDFIGRNPIITSGRVMPA